MQFTASDELRKKLEHAQDLMRHSKAEGDLAVVVERAVDLLLEKLEKQRLGKTTRPRASREQSDTARISQATRRAVFERDEYVARKIRERTDPRQRGYASESCDLAASGLVNMGFRRAEVELARDTVGARHRAEELAAIPVQTILREALAVLT